MTPGHRLSFEGKVKPPRTADRITQGTTGKAEACPDHERPVTQSRGKVDTQAQNHVPGLLGVG